MSTDQPSQFKSDQYEFNDEQNRTISQLADGMSAVVLLTKLLGLAFLVLFGLQLYITTQKGTGADGPVAGLGAATLLCLSIGFWTGGSSHSFRRVVETKNEDVWHMMNALESLKNMYGLLRAIIIASLVLIMVGLALAGNGMISRGG